MHGWGWQSVHDPAMLPNVIERWRDSLETGTEGKRRSSMNAFKHGERSAAVIQARKETARG